MKREEIGIATRGPTRTLNMNSSFSSRLARSLNAASMSTKSLKFKF